MEIQESFGKISGKISEMLKIPGRNFSGKFPGNSGCFSWVSTRLQSKNLLFMFIKDSKIGENFESNFRKIS